MKLYKISLVMFGAALLTTSCNDIDEQYPETGVLTKEQNQEINEIVPERAQATFQGMFSIMATPHRGLPGTANADRADDFGYVMAAFSLDLEGADMFMQNNNYNWFSVCGEYSSRNADYANPYIRYVIPYRQIGIINDVISGIDENTDNPDLLNQRAQAFAMRAYAYMALATYFAFNFSHPDDPRIPILKADTDYGNNPRASVKEVWESIKEDLDYAVANLTADRTGKDQINVNVAYGLRARANLYMGNYAEAAADAEKAMQGFTPASQAEISVPAFCNLNEHNWIWGINVPTEMAQIDGSCTSSSWLSAFSGDGYAAATENVPTINRLLYNKIADTDIRKNWWLDENLHTPNWAGLTWTDPKTGASATGDEIAKFEIEELKAAFLPLNSVKFGMKSGVGSIINNNDFPLMRVEEMILIQVEGLAKSGNEARAKQILENFVKTYRDPAYSVEANLQQRGLSDEIWFQRRVELWGEGFFMFDCKRLGKPVVRTHGSGTTNQPAAFAFNIAATDGWLNMRFPQTEMDNNKGVVDNTGGQQPVAGQNPNLRDGVTD